MIFLRLLSLLVFMLTMPSTTPASETKGELCATNATNAICEAEVRPRVKKVVVSENTVCVLVEKNVFCDGVGFRFDMIKKYMPKEFENPTDIAVNGDAACVLDNNEMKCFGKLTYLDYPVHVKNGTNLQMNVNRACALSEGSIVCGGPTLPMVDGEIIDYSIFASNVSSHTDSFCTIGARGANCWNTADYQNPRPFAPGDGGTKFVKIINGLYADCAISDRSRVKCVARVEPDRLPFDIKGVEALTGVQDLGMDWSTHNLCAISSGKVFCWGPQGGSRIEGIDDAFQLSMRGGYACAATNSGVKCWGRNWNSPTFFRSVTSPAPVFDMIVPEVL
jgi:hypothetical protein